MGKLTIEGNKKYFVIRGGDTSTMLKLPMFISVRDGNGIGDVQVGIGCVRGVYLARHVLGFELRESSLIFKHLQQNTPCETFLGELDLTNENIELFNHISNIYKVNL